MNLFLLISIVVGMVAGQALKRSYTDRFGNVGAYTFSALTLVAALLFLLIPACFGFTFSAAILPYALIQAICTVGMTLFAFFAIREGSLALTALLLQYGLIVPTLYGIVVLKEPVSLFLVVGLVLLLVSLFLINREPASQRKTVTLRWAVYATLSSLCSAACSTVQKAQQVAMPGRFATEFLVVGFFLSAVTMGIIAGIKEKGACWGHMKNGWLLGSLCGLALAVTNYFTVLLSGRMSASLMFPLESAAGIILTTGVSILLYKERLNKSQLAGLLLGAAAVVFLNL